MLASSGRRTKGTLQPHQNTHMYSKGRRNLPGSAPPDRFQGQYVRIETHSEGPDSAQANTEKKIGGEKCIGCPGGGQGWVGGGVKAPAGPSPPRSQVQGPKLRGGDCSVDVPSSWPPGRGHGAVSQTDPTHMSTSAYVSFSGAAAHGGLCTPGACEKEKLIAQKKKQGPGQAMGRV